MIIDYGAFVERLTTTARLQRLGLTGALVRYYDEDVFNGEFKLKDVPFRKQKRFEYQREFRVSIRPGAFDPLQRTISIGPLGGMATYVPSEHLLNALKITAVGEAA